MTTRTTIDSAVLALALVAAVGALAPARPAAAAPPAPKGTATDLETRTLEWRDGRVARLRTPDGWLSVVGLSWLQQGDNTVGSSKDATVRLPASAPPQVGNFRLDGRTITFLPAGGAGVTVGGKPAGQLTMATDRAENPTRLQIGSVTFSVIERGDRFGVRVKDSRAPALSAFRGLDYFPISPKWVIEAKWEPYATPRKVSTPTVIGTVEQELVPGAAVFEVGGTTCRLEPIEEDGELFFVFGDATNGSTSYGGGRFLYTPMPKNGKVTLDFNRAYNPPCVFTAYATCPLPRKENRLAVQVEAGEKGYRGGAHH